ncbi:MGMT family protein [Salidesulfovibrio onnuriiensis]|uniref:MGMT family protein n=1 Tax=Salidesulfovibrio onnuriiensis TaxID=2583823 RepID=UPI0011C84BC8|nr:MGMT family protein [Salidesulfovibrio onnuriiensis]
MTQNPFSRKVIALIRAIPAGRVASYGGIARLAGSPRAARQVVRLLHSSSRKECLPWHRVVNREGRIGLKDFEGYSEQKRRLELEGVEFGPHGRIYMERFEWRPTQEEARRIAPLDE